MKAEARKERQTGRSWLALLVVLLHGSLSVLHAQVVLTPWIAHFKGVFRIAGTNTPGPFSGLPHRMAMGAARIDLTDPDIRLFTTPRLANYVEDLQETGGLTVSEFVARYQVSIAINANFYRLSLNNLPPMEPMDVYGLQISEGVMVSPQGSYGSASFLFDRQNHATFLSSNQLAPNVLGVYTAVSGNYRLLVNGTNVARSYTNSGGQITGVAPRTAVGLSADRRWLYLMTIDGRQSGYSDGAFDFETAEWMSLIGASDAINLDGGGSTTMAVLDTTGAVVRINRPSDVADSGRERTVASHFGVYARPLPSFFGDIDVRPRDITAEIRWKSEAPSGEQVQYGQTPAMESFSSKSIEPVINHTVTLRGLVPDQLYYYRIFSTADGVQYVSSNFVFRTTNYVGFIPVIALTNKWKYSDLPVSTNWTQKNYNDAGWNGPFPAMFWTDTRGSNAAIEPKGTQIAGDRSNSGFPFVTEYFRTRFALPAFKKGGWLNVKAYVDDGAVFYVNGTEVYRLRMPQEWDASTPALGFPCDGDATCADEFVIALGSLPNIGEDNVLAVEVHNYNVHSPDLTFGLALGHVVPLPETTSLQIKLADKSIILSWTGSRATIQRASFVVGPWTDHLANLESPVTMDVSDVPGFYRLVW